MILVKVIKVKKISLKKVDELRKAGFLVMIPKEDEV